MNFNYFMPTRIIFGAGRLKELATIPHLPGKKALVVIGAGGSMRKYGYLDRVVGYLKDNGVGSIVYDKILPNPVSEHVDEGAAVAKEHGCDFTLGLGGGSSIDSSKSIAVMAVNPGKYWDYIGGGSGGGKTPPNGALPIVTVTTTAGTGTEANPWTVMTKSETNEKIGWGNDTSFPVLSIVDPELMLSVPPKITADTGMDALFHNLESYLSVMHQPTSDHLALEAISLISRYLPIAVKDGKNLEARTKLAWANTEGGICNSLSTCLSHHSMEHAISAYYPKVSHGAGLVMTSGAYFSYLAERVPERFPALARAMGEDVNRLPEAEKPFAFITALKKLIKNIGIEDEKLSKYGVKQEEMRAFAQNSFDNMGGLYDVTPVKLTVDDVTKIFENAYA